MAKRVRVTHTGCGHTRLRESFTNEPSAVECDGICPRCEKARTMKVGVPGTPLTDDSHITFEQVHEAVMRSSKNRAAAGVRLVEQYGTGMHTAAAVARRDGLTILELPEYLPMTRTNGEPYRYALVRGAFAVEAECHSDDHKYEVVFDAWPFFEAATDDQIRRLADCGWGGDYPADDVAIFCAEGSECLGRLFEYLSHEPTMPYSNDRVGFECYVDEASARAWLKFNRPALEEELFGEAAGLAA